jgi:hypothetical protein
MIASMLTCIHANMPQLNLSLTLSIASKASLGYVFRTHEIILQYSRLMGKMTFKIKVNNFFKEQECYGIGMCLRG